MGDLNLADLALFHMMTNTSTKNTITHPAFILGILSYLLLLIGVVLRADEFWLGKYLLIAAPVLGFVHWVWSMVSVLRDPRLKGTESRVVWLLVVIILAPIGGMLYFVMKRKRISF